MDSQKRILDPCCGSRMMHFDRANPDVVFGDRRSETIVVTDRSHGKQDGTRELIIAPDVLLDFRALPFADETFNLVVFDPPHLERAGPKSWLAAKYGKLSDNWREDLRAGFVECFRVLKPDSTLIFKWNETQVKLSEVLALTPHTPTIGNTSGKKAGTHWLVFMKPRLVEAGEEVVKLADLYEEENVSLGIKQAARDLHYKLIELGLPDDGPTNSDARNAILRAITSQCTEVQELDAANSATEATAQALYQLAVGERVGCWYGGWLGKASEAIVGLRCQAGLPDNGGPAHLTSEPLDADDDGQHRLPF